jgi:hypothetical protein
MNQKSPGLLVFLLSFSVLSFVACAPISHSARSSETGEREFDPASADLPDFDATNPPRLSETIFENEGAGMNAIGYEAQGPGPYPTVVLLHEFSGNERNLDLAKAIRRAGWNAVFFH